MTDTDLHAVEAALAILNKNGFDIASPRDGDLDDLEQERFNAVTDACRAYLSAAQEGREAVAYRCTYAGRIDGMSDILVWNKETAAHYEARGWEVTPLYTHPAPAQPAAQVVVKALEWENVRVNYGPETYESKSPVGLYQVFTDEDSAAGAVLAEWALDSEHFGMTNATSIGRYPGFDEAKAAAQADYERRILSALAAPVSQDPVAWRAIGEDNVSDLTERRDIADQWERDGIPVTPLYASPQPTEGEPSDAEVASYENVSRWLTEAQRTHFGAIAQAQYIVRAALLAAKSKGGRADG